MRVAAYARVSSEEQTEGWSLDAQKNAMYDFAARNHHVVVDFYWDDSTGTDDQREGFQRMIQDARAKKFDAILVYHTSRFFRNISLARQYKRLLREHLGVDVVSVTQPTGDSGTPQAYLSEGVNELFDEYYSITLSFWTSTGKRTRAENGFYNGDPPYGYCKGNCSHCTVPRAEQVCSHFGQIDQSRDGVLIPHPINQKGLLSAFQQCAEGATDREIATGLNNADYRTDSVKRGANLFTKDTIRRILMNPFYLGYVTYKGTRIAGKHPALINDDLWDRAQAARIMNRKSPRAQTGKRKQDRTYPLTGLLRCSRCDGSMHGNGAWDGSYICYTKSQRKDACSQPLVKLGVLEGQLGEYLATFHIPEDYQRKILEQAGKDGTLIEDLESRRASLEARLRRLQDLYELGDKSREEYLSRRTEITAEIASLKPAEDNKADLRNAAELLGRFCEAWAIADLEQKRKIARLIFEEIWVENKKVVTVRPRPQFTGFFTLDLFDRRKRRESPHSHPLPLYNLAFPLSLAA
jgi:site-specific DNA recombinase